MEKLLKSGEAIEVRDRHLDYFLQSTQQAPQREEKIRTLPDDTEWMDRMESEHGNLRTALEWSTANHPDKALRLIYIVGNFWVGRDYNVEDARLVPDDPGTRKIAAKHGR